MAMRLLLLLLSASLALGQRVVCLGDSITAGSGLISEHHWPRLLQERLGVRAEVLGLGVGGATMLRGTDRPYVETSLWTAERDFSADVAVVILGTNDTVLQEQRKCWDKVATLETDVLILLQSIEERCGAGRVLLCSPPPMFPGKDGLDEARAADLAERAPRIAELAKAYRRLAARLPKVEFVDLSRTLGEEHVTDGVHLTPFGSAAIADRLAGVLRTPRGSRGNELVDQGIDGKHGNYHGYERVDFALPEDGAACILVRPDTIAAGRPWLWRARFFNHQPDLDLDLLERGFHLVYVDVANLYGSPKAVRRWELAYEMFTRRLGLGPKPVLLGMSRGGLPVLNFAIAHPDRVGAIVLDNAVCDSRTWPGGSGGKRSDEDWARLLEAYELDDSRAFDDGRSPIDRLEPVAAAKLPVHVLIGTEDEVVPPATNGELLIKRLTKLGAPPTVWRKPGQGHHPHGLHPPRPLVRALLRQTGVDLHNPAAWPLSSVEYRGGAGWGGMTWWGQLEAMRALAAANPDLEVVFFGDSITQGLTGHEQRVTQAGGVRAIDRFPSAISLGLSGDRTEHLLYRAEHGALAILDPKVIVVQIGINNINAAKHTGAETAAGLRALVQRLREREPQATLILCGPFPCGLTPSDPRRAAVNEVHLGAAALADGKAVRYLDLRPLFLDENGAPNGRMAGDALHISGAGQSAWMEALAEPIGAILKR